MESIDYDTLHNYTQQVFKSTGFVSQSTGEVIDFTPMMKIIYLTFLNEMFHSKGELDVSQQSIADTLSVDRKTINRNIRVLLEHGILSGEKRTNASRGFTHWVYSDVMFPINLEAGGRSNNTSLTPVRKSIKSSVRFEVLRRNKFCCSYCGKAAVDGWKLVVDHIHPVSKGGTNDIENLTSSCEKCNYGKGSSKL